MPDPQRALEDALATFADREARASASVVVWHTGRTPRRSLLPLHDERAHPHARAGAMSKKRAEPRHGIVEYGYDGEGRLRVVREHALRGQKGLLHQLVLVDYDADTICWTAHHESAGRSVLEVGAVHHEGGVPMRGRVVSRHAVIEERYVCDAHGRIAAIEVHTERGWGSRRAERSTTRFTISRDEPGEIVRVDYARGTTYARPRASPRATIDALVEALARASLLALEARAEERETAFALAITWSSAEPLPPLVQLGTASDRARLGPDCDDRPLEWRTTLPVHDDPPRGSGGRVDHAALAMVMIFSGAANVGFWMLLSALTADVTDVDAERHGERREGLFAGFLAFTKKLAVAGASAGVGVGLSLIGYEEHVTPSADVVFGLELLFAVPTTILVVIALFLFRRYDKSPPASGRHAGARDRHELVPCEVR